ncbi:Abi family protein [Erwinia phyllosphaerae]|uniref:Abi family protein n=1 Tax=Erwinia phyllosphaerae TaxID=2853256 RepID=UPI001FEE6DC1|nr:Abi family protein [Erwinia phyllosphaerae]MBV4365132.1 Abi family protein [Erwinia phyllosphaerae]
MAESQVPYDYAGNEASLIENLSKERFAPYLKSAGFNTQYAFSLYLYNARLSKSFLYPLHILEVTLRNRMSEVFSVYFDEKWFDHSSFRSGLSDESMDALDRGIRRAKKPNKEDIISTLTFDFWSNLFRPEYDRFVWQKNMKNLLPNVSMTRKEFEKTVKGINDFRNRIAHYEPIHKMNLSQMHIDILHTLQWLSTETSLWVKHHSTVNECLRMKPSPKGNGSVLISDRCDKDFTVVTLDENISKINNSKFTICVDSKGDIKAVLKKEHLANYIMSQSEDDEIIIDLKSHDVSTLIEKMLVSNVNICDAGDPYICIGKYFKSRVSFLVVLDKGEITGVVEKAHRRY